MTKILSFDEAVSRHERERIRRWEAEETERKAEAEKRRQAMANHPSALRQMPDDLTPLEKKRYESGRWIA